MSLRILALLCGLTRLLMGQAEVCRPVESDRILAKDLAAVLPEFGALPPDTLLGNTPPPGSQRIFHHAEVLSLAERYSVHTGAEISVCFERAMETLDRNRVLEAMRLSLGVPDAHVELSETSLYLVPKGRIEFTLEHLGTPASRDQQAPVLWRGDVIYGAGHRFAIWARVRLTARCTRVVAADNLKPGHPIERSQLRTITEEAFPTLKPEISISEMVGMVPLRPIAAGTPLYLELVSRPNDVHAGDLVDIEVRSGAARLLFTARAESGGRNGETILIRNPQSNKTFPAQITGKGRAIVLIDSAKTE